MYKGFIKYIIIKKSKNVDEIKTDFIWNGTNLVAETKSNKTNIYSYGVDGIVTAEINGTTETYLKNAHGDIVGTSGGRKYKYDAFGNVLSGSGIAGNPFRYCGEYYDNESGLIYFPNTRFKTTAFRR